MRKQFGFTLIEVITVMVTLGILAAIGSSFLITTVDSYRLTELRSKLLARGRTAVAQISRQLRLATPNSVRVSPSGSCLEFLPLVGGSNYRDALADSENSAPLTTSIVTAPFLLDIGNPVYVVVGALNASEIYTATTPSARAAFSSGSGSPITGLTLAGGHRFVRNSTRKRVFVSDAPKRFCISGGSLVKYHSYSFDTSAMSDASPGGSTVIMSFDVAASGTAFSLSPGSEDRNATVDIALIFSGNGEQIEIKQQVLIRNVP